MKPHLCSLLLWMICCSTATAQPAAKPPVVSPLLIPEFLWTGSWESSHNLTDRIDFKLSAPRADLALRLQVLDRRPASSAEAFAGSFDGETAGSAITQPGLGLYHLTTGSRLLYGTLDNFGLQARIRNVWIRGAPYAESRTTSSAELKTAPATTAVPQGYAYLESPDLSVGSGQIQPFAFFMADFDPKYKAPAFGFGADYALGKSKFRLEGFYTEQNLPERKSSTWFNEKPALPVRDTRLFAGTAAFSLPAFGMAADLAYSETFAYGQDYYGNLGLRVGDKPWRFSLAMDAAGSRYIDSAGNSPGAGFRAAARLERRGKKTGLFRLGATARGSGPKQGTMPALTAADFAAFAKGINRISGDVYYRFPESSASFGLTRFSFSLDTDGRNAKKVLDSANAMAAFKLGPVNAVTEGKLTGLNRKQSAGTEGSGYALDSYRVSQNFSWTFLIPAFRPALRTIPRAARREKNSGGKSADNPRGKDSGSETAEIPSEQNPSDENPAGQNPTGEKSAAKKTARPRSAPAKLGGSKTASGSAGTGKKTSLTAQLSARAGYEQTAGKDGVWDTSLSASIRSKKHRLTIKAASPNLPNKWEFTISWRMSL